MIATAQEALAFVDTEIRYGWQYIIQKLGDELGAASILEESEMNGMKAWQYHIDGLPMSADARRRWLLDSGETIDTTMQQDENTIEKAYAKKLDIRSTAKLRAQTILKTNDLESKDINGVGFYFYESIRGGSSLIVGYDGGLLFANSSVGPDEMVHAYIDGKRTTEEAFGDVAAGV